MKPEIIKLPAGIRGFVDDKDEAKRIRVQTILPLAKKKSAIVIDFASVKYSTQSFIHALVGEVLQKYGESALEHMEFRNCAPQVKSLVRLVVDYSLGGFSLEQAPIAPTISKGTNIKKADSKARSGKR